MAELSGLQKMQPELHLFIPCGHGSEDTDHQAVRRSFRLPLPYPVAPRIIFLLVPVWRSTTEGGSHMHPRGTAFS